MRWQWSFAASHTQAYAPMCPPPRYKKTQETLSQAGQKTSAALSTVGTAISRRLGDMRYVRGWPPLLGAWPSLQEGPPAFGWVFCPSRARVSGDRPRWRLLYLACLAHKLLYSDVSVQNVFCRKRALTYADAEIVGSVV